MDLSEKKLILGSASPRRRELLEGMGFPFTVEPASSYDEHYDPSLPHREIPQRLAEGKSLAFPRPLAPDEVLITADTLVLCGDEILGKPSGKDDAARMLRLLSGRDHQVITGVCVRCKDSLISDSDTAHVWFKDLSDGEIRYYIDKYSPMDKAGAYGIQEWIGYIGIPRIEGSFYTVMGFPTHLVYSLLNRL